MKLELRVVIRSLGLLLIVLSAVMAVMALFSGVNRLTGDAAEGAAFQALLMVTLAGALGGGAMYLAGRSSSGVIGQREALLVVSVSWILAAGLSALPYWFWAGLRPDAAEIAHDFDRYVNCYFEAMSGLTTAGSSILQVVETVPRSLLLWRATTHWLGGLGIVVLFVAVLPMLGGGSRRVFLLESPGPSPEAVTPRIQDTAQVLWLIYVGLTVAEVIALMVCGMGLFDSVCHTFATLASGGFSTKSASVAAYPSASIQTVIIVFMVLGGVNFALYHALLQGKWRRVRKDPELRAYLAILALGSVFVTLSLLRHPARAPASTTVPASVTDTVRDAVFTVVSIQTTTGFCTADFDQWHFVAKATLLVGMFIGGSAGSTAGGIKVMRLLIAAKVIWAELERAYRPRVVRPIKVGHVPINDDLKLSTFVYLIGYATVFGAGTVLLMAFERPGDIDITTAASACAATLNTTGPGLGKVGAVHNFAWLSDASKVVLSTLMLLGRLELFAVLALFSPRFWREE